jgi:hypothetical protein
MKTKELVDENIQTSSSNYTPNQENFKHNNKQQNKNNQEPICSKEIDSFAEYVETFVQRIPKYAVKFKNSSWKTKNKPLSDTPIKAHLDGQYYVGVLGKWYPEFAVIDIDGLDQDKAEEIREEIGLNTDNSMLFSSESKDSYHILFRPTYNQKPPTLRLLNEALKPIVLKNGVELYPQPNKAIRLPFGLNQKPLDYEYCFLDKWEDKLYWFKKLNEFDLKAHTYKELKPQPLEFEDIHPEKEFISTYQEGKFLYEAGLISSHTRHDSQWKVLYYLLRQNIPPETAVEMTWQWIRKKHNNLSRDILSSPSTVKKEIIRQAKWLYSHYEAKHIYPDSTHNTYYGYITKDDIKDIVMLAKGNIPFAKFVFNLVKFCYPRRFRSTINVHSDHLLKWSKKNYISYLDKLKRIGVVKRCDKYQIDEFSKAIQINWQFRSPSQAILVDYRAPQGFSETIRACFKPEEFRELLKKAGVKKTTTTEAIKRTYSKQD